MALRLKVVAGPGLGTECEIEDAEVTIGRAPENGLVINDNNVSRVHARVTVAPGNRIVVADNGSRNGVYVNDRKVNQQPLSPGDRVVIGQTVIELQSDAPAAAPKRAPGGTGAKQPRPNGNGAAADADRRSNVVPMKNTGAVRQGSTKAMRAGGAGGKEKDKSPVTIPAIIGIVVIGLVVGVGSIVGSGGGNTTAANDPKTGKPKVTHTQPPIPGGVDLGPSNQIEKLPKDVQVLIDLGDSQRTSGNLVGARRSYKSAQLRSPNCDSCKVRRDAVDKDIEIKILEREKAGEQAYQAGDYNRAMDQWENAIDYIDDPASPRSKSLTRKVQEMKPLIQQQPQ